MTAPESPRVEPRRRDLVAEQMRARSRRAWVRVADVANRRAGRVAPARAPIPEPVPAQPAEAVLDLLRLLGVALCQAGDATDRIIAILDDVARVYDARGVSFFVLQTGVFVRIETGGVSRVDFAPVTGNALRLDQVDALYRIIDDIRFGRVEVAGASERLLELHASRPRFGPVVTVLASGLLTLGLGLMLNPTVDALPAYVLLGFLVGGLRWWADRDRMFGLFLSVATAFLVTWVAFDVAAPLLDAPALELVIPSLVTLLPGAALTVATIELSAGSVVTGSTRLVSGLERLLLLTFGIAMGVQVAGLPPEPSEPPTPLGPWAPWLGVLVFGLGQYIATSAPKRTLRWLLPVLYLAYVVQAGSGLLLGSLGGSFLAAAVVLPVAYWVQYLRGGPPVMVTFLPAFWLLVPGALGLQGVTKLVSSSDVAGLGDFLNALLSIIAIAVGVLVGTGIAERTGRLTSTWRGI